jgi:ATP-binding cassette subfamily F protein uup
MANILSVDNLTHHWGDIRLFSNISFGLEEGQKSALIARNGTGKTTLLNIIAQKLIPDAGSVTIRNNISTTYLTQDPQIDGSLTVWEALINSNNPVLYLIKEYELALSQNDKQNINSLIEKMDQANAWDYENKLKQILSELKITDFLQQVSQLSGGQIKRVALASALINEPDF